ncbi:MAG: glycosyltransferase [Chloroflexi bacterium]|nr:MAG: glycosyltransferase [Chloroflexota bacterium]
MLVYGNAHRDPRVRQSAEELAANGYEVDVFGVALQNVSSGLSTVNDVHIYILPLVNRLSVAFKQLWPLMRGRMPQWNGGTRSSGLAILFYWLWVLRLGLVRRYHIIHCHEHQPMPVAWLLARMKRVPWIYDAHEPLPANRTGRGRKASMAIRIEEAFLRRADAVITVGGRLAKELRDRGAKEVVVIGSWKRLEQFRLPTAVRQEIRQKLNIPQDALAVVYIGVLQPDRRIAPLLEAAADAPDIHIIIGGYGPDEPLVTDMAQQHTNIHWLGAVPLDDVARYTAAGDAIYYCLNPNAHIAYYSTPNKLFEALAAGRPVIALHNVGELSDILEDVGAGVWLNHPTKENVLDAFEQLRDPARHAALQEAARKGGDRYHWGIAAQRLLDLYGRLMA